MFSSLKNRLYMLVFISVIPVCTLILYTAFEQRRAELKKIEQNVLYLVEAAAIEEAQILEGARQLLMVLGNYLGSVRYDPSSCSTFFSEVLGQFARYANLGAVKPDGSVYCSTGPLKSPEIVRDRKWFKQTLESLDFSVGRFSVAPSTGDPVWVVSYPVLGADRQAAAVVFAVIDINWLSHFTSDASIQIPAGSTLSQMDAAGVLISYQPEKRAWIEGKFSDGQLYRSVSNKKRGIIESHDDNGNLLISAFAPLTGAYRDREATFILSVPAKIAYADSNRSLRYHLALLAAVFVLAMIAARLASHYFVLRDIEALVRANEMLAQGNLNTRIRTIRPKGELGQLAVAFNKMASALEKQDKNRKVAEEKLKNSREKLRNLTEYIQTVREKERTRIAREIHDNLGQALTALKMDLSWLDKRLAAGQTEIMDKIDSMAALIQETIQIVQRVSAELRPGILDDFGLVAAIEWQAEEFQQRTNINTRVSLTEEPIDISKDQSTAVFRIYQEALTNVIRHANASEVEVVLEKEEGRLLLTIKDNGRGISPEEISSPRSFGLIGMQERVYPWKGEVIFQGLQNQGSTVTVSIPLAEGGKLS